MKYNFLNIFLERENLLGKEETGINPFLLENNANQILALYDFYKSESSIAYVNGFLGTGKADIVNYSTSFLSKETILLKYNCFNSTILDDILLAFFEEFKKLSSQNAISAPKIKSENFTQKINSYFSNIEKPFVIILDSFEAILSENRQEILDFIFHLKTQKKIKVILIGRTFESKYFEGANIERITTFALERQIFDKYLKSEKIKAPNAIVDEFYKHTRGYYFFTAFSLKLMKKDNLSLVDFLTRLKESYLPLSNYLVKESLNLVPSGQKNPFWFLVIIRHPISVTLLNKLGLLEEEKINYLIENLVLIKDNDSIYVQDYIKRELDDSILPNIANKIHQYIIDLYQTQLPLKPLERDILISRQTMRKEIEYHEFFLPKKPKNVEPAMDINYLSYAKTLEFKDKEKTESDIKQEKAKEEKPTYQIKLPSKKNIAINIENLPFQNKEEQAQKKESPNKIQKDFENKDIAKIYSFKELLFLIQQAAKDYRFSDIIDLAEQAISLKQDKNYQTYIPLVYTKLAQAYHETGKHEKALKYFEQAHELYIKAGKNVKADYIKMSISKILYEDYKIEKAKSILNQIIQKEENPTTLKTKALLRLANIEENLSNTDAAFNIYQEAQKFADEQTDLKTLCELYFKYALALDDKNDSIAFDFYKKCIETSDNPKINKYLSAAYSNIASFYLEKRDTQNAIDNYKKSYEIDKLNKNQEGMYYSASKLATILQRKTPELAIGYFKTALDCAKMTKDPFYIVSATLALGDFYYDKKQNEIALMNYLKALESAQNNLSQDNINKINVRINDIKFRLGVENFDKLVEIINEQNLMKEQEHE